MEKILKVCSKKLIQFLHFVFQESGSVQLPIRTEGAHSTLVCVFSLMFLMFLAVVISVTKEGVKFSTGGDIGTANIVCRQNTSVDKVGASLAER